MKRMQSVVQQSNEIMTQSVNTQLSRMNMQLTNMNVEGNANFKEMERTS